MADLVEFLKEEQGDESPEAFANKIGIRYASLYSYYKSKKELGVKNARSMAQYYKSKDQMDKVYLIASVLIGIELPPPEQKPTPANNS